MEAGSFSLRYRFKHLTARLNKGLEYMRHKATPTSFYPSVQIQFCLQLIHLVYKACFYLRKTHTQLMVANLFF